MARRRRDPKRETFWREVLRRQAVGSVGVRAFCQQEKLTESAFHWWRRTIAQRDAQSRRRNRQPSCPWWSMASSRRIRSQSSWPAAEC